MFIAIGCFLFGPSKLFGVNNWVRSKDDCLNNYYDCRKPLDTCRATYDSCIDSAHSDRIIMLIASLIVLGSASGTVVVPILLELV